jgi:hypothetical protein
MANWLGIVIGLIALVTSAPVRAADLDLPYRKSVADRSKAEALGSRMIQPLERVAGPGRDAVMARVLERFAPALDSVAVTPVRVEASFSIATGNGWFVEVRGNGEWIRFRNHGYITQPSYVQLPIEKRPAATAIEAQARGIIASQLAEFVQLVEDEELQGWTVSYLLSMSADSSGAVERAVAATKVVFTRVIAGVPVLGPGGKVAVTLANDSTIVGIDIDWPQLTPTGQQVATPTIAIIRARGDEMLGIDQGITRPTERGFECGYYDPGIHGGAGARVGPACVLVVDPYAGSGGFLPKVVIPM